MINIDTRAANVAQQSPKKARRITCPRCEQARVFALHKLDAAFNTCYQCRRCGHVFSPTS